MKRIPFLFDNYSPPRKCGIETAIGAALIGAGSTVGSTMVSSGSNKDAIKANKEEAQKNRDFNREEAEKQRQWASDEWQKQFDTQTNEWYRQTDYGNQQSYDYWQKQQEYYSPQAQVQRAVAAGLNPATAVGSAGQAATGGLSAAGSSVPNPSVPAGQGASITTPNPAGATSAGQEFAGIAGGIGELVSGLAQASKDSADAKLLLSTMTSKIIQQDELAKQMKYDTNLKEIDTLIASGTLPAKVEKAFAECRGIYAQAYKDFKNGDLFEVKMASERAHQALMDSMKRMNDEQFEILSKFNMISDDYFNAKINQMNSQSIVNRSQVGLNAKIGDYYRAQTDTEDALRDSRVSISNFQAKVSEIDWSIRANTKMDDIKRINAQARVAVAEAERQGLITEEVAEHVRKLRKENNYMELQLFMSAISQAVGAAAGGAVGMSAVMRAMPAARSVVTGFTP